LADVSRQNAIGTGLGLRFAFPVKRQYNRAVLQEQPVSASLREIFFIIASAKNYRTKAVRTPVAMGVSFINKSTHPLPAGVSDRCQPIADRNTLQCRSRYLYRPLRSAAGRTAIRNPSIVPATTKTGAAYYDTGGFHPFLFQTPARATDHPGFIIA